MLKICDRCNDEIKISYLLKQPSLDRIICPNCGRKMKVTDLSKVMALTIFITILSLFLILPIYLLYKIFFMAIWNIFSYCLLKPLVYTYKVEDE